MSTLKPNKGEGEGVNGVIARRFAVVLVVVAALVLQGGSGSRQGFGAPQPVVGHSFPDLQNPYYVSVRESAAENFKQLGYKYVVTDSTQDPAKQVQDVEDLIQRHVDVLFIDAVDPKAVVPAYQAANKAGVPVVALIREPAGGHYVSFVYLDSVKHGRIACQFIVEKLGGKGNVVELQGIMATQPGQERSRGCRQALSKVPGIKLVASQAANFNRVDALKAMDNILQAHHDVDAVFGANDEEALGAIESLKAAGIDPSKKVIVGIDGTQVALQSICKRELTATVATIGKEEGKIIADLAAKIVQHQSVPSRVEFKEVFVTKDNVVAVEKRSGWNFDCAALAPKH